MVVAAATALGPRHASAEEADVALRFEGNQVLPNEVYASVLELAKAATSTTPTDLASAERFVEEQLTGFLRASGYLLATVDATPDERGGLRVAIDEGRLDRVIVLGEGVVRTLQVQLNLEIPQDVFNRFVLERQLAQLVRDRGLKEATYRVVPMKEVNHVGIQLTPATLLGGNAALAPGAPHELLITLKQPDWRTGFGYGVGFQSPDGFFLSGSYRTASLLLDDDRWINELQIAFRSVEALFSSNNTVGLSRVESINRWYGPPILDIAQFRPRVEIDLKLQSRFRNDLQIDRYQFAPLSAAFDLTVEPLRGLIFAFGGGVEYRQLFNVDPKDDAVLDIRTSESTFRAFGEAEATWDFEPKSLRQDRHDRLELLAKVVSGRADLGGFVRLLGEYELSFSIGYDELWFEVDGALLLGDVPFYDEVALGDGFVRLGYSGDFFTRQAASLTTEYRLSLNRDAFKISLFNDAAIFQELRPDRSAKGLQFTDSVGLGVHFLVLTTFQVNFYGGVGFVPGLSPQPGVSLKVRQAF